MTVIVGYPEEPETIYPEVGEDPANDLTLAAVKFPIAVALVSVANGNLSIAVLVCGAGVESKAEGDNTTPPELYPLVVDECPELQNT